MEEGRLPYLEHLATRGRISFEASTVDKSETMKVVQSYLTSRLDTEVVGWWQFDRSDLRFRNYWLDPAEVVSYALGLRFPASPTIQDFLASRGENLVAGMSLARRGVDFDNYARAYLEGIDAVSAHTYHRQADATMRGFLAVHERIVRSAERSPALSTLLLAAADEFAHAEGVTVDAAAPEHCFARESVPDDTIFRLLEEDGDRPYGGALGALEPRYFTRVVRTRRKVSSVCLAIPRLRTERGLRRAHPLYVLSYAVLDIELGYLIESLRSIRFAADGRRYLDDRPGLWKEAASDGGEETSLFDRTLFLVFGDHGMVDTPKGMADGLGSQLGAGSLDESFLAFLNRRLSLTSASGAPSLPGDVELGIDDLAQPLRLSQPETHAGWQPPHARAAALEADAFSRELVSELRSLLRDQLHQDYWWLFFLRSLFIDPKLDAAIDPISDRAVSTFRRLYLRSLPEYLEAERAASRDFFDAHVRLVYGGGARNNAELFLPACDQSGCSWERRPSHAQILSYRGGRASETTLLEALFDNPGVGLVFLRRSNELIAAEAPLPSRLEIDVLDRAGRAGRILVRRDETTSRLSFHYRTDPASKGDPLGQEPWSEGEGSWGTYREWNDRSVRGGSGPVNAVGGVGSYLYSDNPAIGDVLVTHAEGWNFGTNRGGHGGVDREEKTTFLLASGPGVGPGELMARRRYETDAEGRVILVAEGTSAEMHAPSLLDLAPTALAFLGHEPEALAAFAESGFAAYLEDWRSRQRSEILSRLDEMDTMDRARAQSGLDELSLAPLEPLLSRLLAFVDSEGVGTRTLSPAPSEGSRLVLE